MKQNWYQQQIEDLWTTLKTSPEGLSSHAADERLQKYGPNRLPEGEGANLFLILLHQFTSPLIYILLIAAAVTAFLGEYIDMGVIIAVLILNALIGFIQEYKAEKSVRALKSMVVAKARVLREGREQEIPSESLVPGDIVLLASGMKVPADLRLFQTTELRIEEAALTGESIPAQKGVKPIEEANLTPGDQINMAFMGTIVVNGRARGVVVETGSGTVLGKIAHEVKELAISETPLQKKIAKFAQFIGILVLGSAAAISILGISLGMALTEIFKTAVAASVAAIPEGLPIVVTITMAIGIRRMAKRNAIIRKLPAVETLGSTTIICSDKTGTLTKNEMTVKAVYDGEHSYGVLGSGYDPEGEITHEWQTSDPKTCPRLQMACRIGMLCNESRLYEENGQFRVDGDPTEGALIVLAVKAGLNLEEERKRYRPIDMVPFESERGFMATLHRHGEQNLLFMKGAPEKVLDRCLAIPEKGGIDKAAVQKTGELYASDGLRVLAMAYKEVPQDRNPLTPKDLEGDFLFSGLVGMIDPARPEAEEAIQGCKKAGIRVAMITGDHAVTAAAVGKMIGIERGSSPPLEGKELEVMGDDELFAKVQKVSVFARISPQHKLRIVQQFMRHGEVVAVTGDGVNDAPALKAAHIGVAMGKSGTDVAREAADMIITDDNFATIFHAVKEGRVVFDNIRKVTLFLIPTGFAAILSILIAMILDLPIPYVAAQLLWINLVTNGLQDVALAFESGDQDILDRPPRRPAEGIMSRLMFERSILVAAMISIGVVYNFVWALQEGLSLERSRTIAVTTMVLFQFFQAWNSRSELQSVFRISPFSNPFLLYSMIGAFLAQIAVVYVPPLQWVFRTEALTVGEWMRITLVAGTVIVGVELDKGIRRRRRRSHSPG